MHYPKNKTLFKVQSFKNTYGIVSLHLRPMLPVLMMKDIEIIKVFFDQMNLKHLLTQTP